MTLRNTTARDYASRVPFTRDPVSRAVQVIASMSSGSALPDLPTAVLLEAFESTTGWSAPSGTLLSDTVGKVQGNAALRFQGNGVSGTNIITNKTLGAPVTPGSLGVVARHIRKNTPRGNFNIATVFGNGSNSFANPLNGVNSLSLGSDLAPGGYWSAFHESEDPMIAGLGTITQVRVRTNTQAAPYLNDGTIDALYANAKGRPTFVIGFDDGEDSAYDVALPYMSARGMVGTVYIPTSYIGVSDSLTWNEVRALRDAGWGICLDGMPDDSRMTDQASVAAVVSAITSQWSVLTAQGLASDDMYHFCYPFGTSHVTPAEVQLAAVTGNGTTTVNFGAAAAVTNGMNFYGAGVPDGTTVVSGGGASVTSVTLSNPVPAQTKAAQAIDLSGPFTFGKLPAALKAAGFKSGRITGGFTYFSRFGFSDMALETPAYGFTNTPFTAIKALIDRTVLRGETMEFYIHRIEADPVGGWTESTQNSTINTHQSFFYALVDYINSYVQAGLAVVLTKPQLYNRDYLATPP